MSEEKEKFDVCPECKVREGDSSKKTLYKCSYCKRWFCFRHFDAKLAVFKDFKATIKDKLLKDMIEEDWKRTDGHPDYPYTVDRLKEHDIEKEIDRKIIEDMLNRSKAYRKRKPKKRKKEGDFYFIKESETRRKKSKSKVRTIRKLSRKIKAVGILAVSLIIVSILFLSWTNFFAQLVMPHFVNTTHVETEIFVFINEERANRGLPTLLKDEALTTIALQWSECLIEIGDLTHGDFEVRIAQIGYSEYQCGEIIAKYSGWSSALGREFVDMWLSSIGHRETMLTALNGYMGVGISKIGTTFYAVVDFRFS